MGKASLGVVSVVVAQVASSAVASAAEPKVDGFDVLGNVGYGTTTETDDSLFGFMLGVDAGYTFRFGLRLGLNYTHGFGREIEETRTGVGGVESPVHTLHPSEIIAASVGYDWLLNPIRLRASVDQGLIFVDGGRFDDVPAYTYVLAPGIAALGQVGPLELGAGFKYYWLLGAGFAYSGSLMAGGRFF